MSKSHFHPRLSSLLGEHISQQDYPACIRLIEQAIAEGRQSAAVLKNLLAMRDLLEKRITTSQLAHEPHDWHDSEPETLASPQPVQPSSFFYLEKPRVSLVTSVFNRFWQLRQTLPANLDAAYAAGATEVVLIDFGGDDSDEIASFIEDELQFYVNTGILRYLRVVTPWSSFSMARAKNTACCQSRGDLIVSVDADNFVTCNDISAWLEIISHQGAEASFIIHQTTNEKSPILSTLWQEQLPARLKEQHVLHSDEILWDGSCGRVGATRSLFFQIGGYNEYMSYMGMDDIDFLLRSLRLGAAYIYQSLSDRPREEIFIDQGSSDKEHQHNNNDNNWKIMLDGLVNRPLSDTGINVNPEKVQEVESIISRFTAGFQTCLFSVVFRSDPWLDRLERQCREIARCDHDCAIVLVEIQGSNSMATSRRLAELANHHVSIIHVLFVHDIGLYNTWNAVIKSIQSPFIGNLNPDDYRPSSYHLRAVEILHAGVADIAYAWSVPCQATQGLESDLLAKEQTVWFKDLPVTVSKRGEAETMVSHFSEARDSVLSQEHLFQVQSNGIVAPYTVPNASALWRRQIHDAVGFFQEFRYGSYADLEFWCRCLAHAYQMHPTGESSLFFIGDGQAHRRQARQYRTLTNLVLAYGSSALKEAALSSSLDFSICIDSYGDHHYLGWNWVRDYLLTTFVSNPDGIVLDLFLERTFFWDKHNSMEQLCTRPWLGFVHTTAHSSPYFNEDAERLSSLVYDKRFREASSHCLGLITLSRSNSQNLIELLREIELDLSVYSLFHPLIPVSSATSEMGRVQGCPPPSLYHVGIHLRDFNAFLQLEIEHVDKYILIPPGRGSEEFLAEKVVVQCPGESLSSIQGRLAGAFTATEEEYAGILQANIVFNRYLEPAGSNLISEAISARSLLVINRHPAFEEVLGTDYPLFYSDLAHARAIICRLLEDEAYACDARRHMDALAPRYSVRSFAQELKLIVAKASMSQQ
jgi:hypothetical protein